MERRKLWKDKVSFIAHAYSTKDQGFHVGIWLKHWLFYLAKLCPTYHKGGGCRSQSFYRDLQKFNTQEKPEEIGWDENKSELVYDNSRIIQQYLNQRKFLLVGLNSCNKSTISLQYFRIKIIPAATKVTIYSAKLDSDAIFLCKSAHSGSFSISSLQHSRLWYSWSKLVPSQ